MADETQRPARLEEATAELEKLVGETDDSRDHSEQLWQTVMECSPDYLMLLDPEGTIRYINRTVPDLSLEQVLGTRIYDYLAPSEQEKARSCLARVVASRQPDSYEVEYRYDSGEVSVFESRVAPVVRGGEVRALVVNSSDVSEHRREAEARAASEARYRSLVEDQTEFIVRSLPDGTRTFVNQAYCRYQQATPEELLGTSFLPRIPAFDQERVRAKLTSLTPEKPWAVGVHRVLLPDGSIGWNEWTDRAVFDERGDIVEIQSVGRDITEQKIAEDRLKASEERHRFLTTNISDAIWTLGLDQRFLYVSPPVERLAGYTPEELRGMSLEEILDEDSYELALHALSEELERDGEAGVDPDRLRTLDLRLRRRDGTLLWTESKMSLMRDEESGAPCGVLGVTRDISAWKETQEALRRSEDRLRLAQRLEAVGQLAGGVAHDFNNLLTVIRGNHDLMMVDFHAQDPRRAHLEEIGKAADKAASLTRQLLAFARRQLLAPEVLSLNEVVAETRRILERLLPEDIEIVADLAPDLGYVEADRGQIEQVLLNLTVNARDAMPRGGELRVTTTNADLHDGYADYEPPVEPGLYVRLRVEDTGVGIPEELQQKIFEPFFTTKEVGEGSGMGLATVYGIIKQSRGYVWVHSSEGEGTTFEVLLPRSEAAKTEPEAPRSKTGIGGSETVLLVEDDDAVRFLARRILKDAGYRVLEAGSGREAIEMCAREGGRIDLVVTDLVMPEMWGDELAQRLRDAFPKIRILYISGYGDRRRRRRKPTKVGSFLEKPFTSQQLLDKVREILDQ